MNINKRGGSSSTDFKELNKYAEKYKEFLKREIEIINPDYIICCGSYWQIIDHVYDYFKSMKEWGNRKKSEPDIDMYYKLNIKGKIVPGDKVKLETKIVKRKGPMGVGEATAYVDGKVVVKAELTFMVG